MREEALRPDESVSILEVIWCYKADSPRLLGREVSGDSRVPIYYVARFRAVQGAEAKAWEGSCVRLLLLSTPFTKLFLRQEDYG